MKPIFIKTLSTISLAAMMQMASAGNITDINVSTLSNNQKVIKIKFDILIFFKSLISIINPPS